MPWATKPRLLRTPRAGQHFVAFAARNEKAPPRRGFFLPHDRKDQKRYCIDTPTRSAWPVYLPARVEVLPAAASTGRLIVGDLISMR